MTEAYRMPEHLHLYPFQVEDLRRMDSMPHVLMFHEMGLGKTIMAINHIMEKDLLPALIISPKSLKLNWYDEIEKWTGLKSLYTESADEAVEVYFNPETDRRNFFLLHHEALAYCSGDPVREMLTRIGWKTVLLDEAHRFRNLHAERTRTLLEFSGRDKSTKFMLLTGTPIVNSTFDLFPMLKLIGAEDNTESFLDSYTRGHQTNYGYKIYGSKNTEGLLDKLKDIRIRRTKEEVLKDLPEKLVQTIKLVMPESQRTTYDNFERMLCIMLDDGEPLTSSNVLSMVTRLRQLSLDPSIVGKKTGSSKTQAILELLEQSQDKWIVASTSKKYIKLLEEKIPGMLIMTGDESLLERYNNQRKFRENPMVKVLGVTMQTGGVGWNFQVANQIIIADPWFNAATIDQQIDRVHRLGQKKRVSVYKLVNERSIDEDIYEIIDRKSKIAEEFNLTSTIAKKIQDRGGYQ